MIKYFYILVVTLVIVLGFIIIFRNINVGASSDKNSPELNPS